MLCTAVSTKVVPLKPKGIRDNADWHYGWKKFGVDWLRFYFTVFTNKKEKAQIHLFVLFLSMSLKHVIPQSKTMIPITHNTFRHRRLRRFCWTTFLKTTVFAPATVNAWFNSLMQGEGVGEGGIWVSHIRLIFGPSITLISIQKSTMDETLSSYMKEYLIANKLSWLCTTFFYCFILGWL